MKLNNKQVIVILGVIIVSSLGLKIHQTYFAPTKNTNTVLINKQIITVEIADTPDKQILGLSNRESLGENKGMLFVFDNSLVRNFWMKDMLIPIDIIWINDRKIVGIEKNAPIPTSDNVPIFNSKNPVDLVLEVNAGYTDKYNISIGDKIYIND